MPVWRVHAAGVAAYLDLTVSLLFQKLVGDLDAVDDGYDVFVGAASFAAGSERLAPRLFAGGDVKGIRLHNCRFFMPGIGQRFLTYTVSKA